MTPSLKGRQRSISPVTLSGAGRNPGCDELEMSASIPTSPCYLPISGFLSGRVIALSSVLVCHRLVFWCSDAPPERVDGNTIVGPPVEGAAM